MVRKDSLSVCVDMTLFMFSGNGNVLVEPEEADNVVANHGVSSSFINNLIAVFPDSYQPTVCNEPQTVTKEPSFTSSQTLELVPRTESFQSVTETMNNLVNDLERTETTVKGKQNIEIKKSETVIHICNQASIGEDKGEGEQKDKYDSSSGSSSSDESDYKVAEEMPLDTEETKRNISTLNIELSTQPEPNHDNHMASVTLNPIYIERAPDNSKTETPALDTNGSVEGNSPEAVLDKAVVSGGSAAGFNLLTSIFPQSIVEQVMSLVKKPTTVKRKSRVLSTKVVKTHTRPKKMSKPTKQNSLNKANNSAEIKVENNEILKTNETVDKQKIMLEQSLESDKKDVGVKSETLSSVQTKKEKDTKAIQRNNLQDNPQTNRESELENDFKSLKSNNTNTKSLEHQPCASIQEHTTSLEHNWESSQEHNRKEIETLEQPSEHKIRHTQSLQQPRESSGEHNLKVLSAEIPEQPKDPLIIKSASRANEKQIQLIANVEKDNSDKPAQTPSLKADDSRKPLKKTEHIADKEARINSTEIQSELGNIIQHVISEPAAADVSHYSTHIKDQNPNTLQGPIRNSDNIDQTPANTPLLESAKPLHDASEQAPDAPKKAKTSKIPVLRQRSVSKPDSKPTEFKPEQIPVRSGIPQPIPSIIKEPNKMIQSEALENDRTMALETVENERHSSPDDEIVTSGNPLKVCIASTKASSFESTTSSKQCSYTRSLDNNDSDSSVSDSNVDELLSLSSYEDECEFADDDDNLKKSNTQVLNTEFNNHADFESVSETDESCDEDEEYDTNEEEDDVENETSNSNKGLEFKERLSTDLNFKVKEPSRIESIEVSMFSMCDLRICGWILTFYTKAPFLD